MIGFARLRGAAGRRARSSCSGRGPGRSLRARAPSAPASSRSCRQLRLHGLRDRPGDLGAARARCRAALAVRPRLDRDDLLVDVRVPAPAGDDGRRVHGLERALEADRGLPAADLHGAPDPGRLRRRRGDARLGDRREHRRPPRADRGPAALLLPARRSARLLRFASGGGRVSEGRASSARVRGGRVGGGTSLSRPVVPRASRRCSGRRRWAPRSRSRSRPDLGGACSTSPTPSSRGSRCSASGR